MGDERRPFFQWLNAPTEVDPCLMTMEGHSMVVRFAAYSPVDDDRIVSASNDHTFVCV